MFLRKSLYDSKYTLQVTTEILLAANSCHPIERDKIYKDIFERAEKFRKYN